MLYLTSSEAADYLRIKERKLYELVANGDIPCSKVTGKWLFPRHELDRWVMSGLAIPPGMQPRLAPPIVGGGRDDLLDWALRESGSGLAIAADTEDSAIEQLQRGEILAAMLHAHALDAEDANPQLVRRARGLHDGVLVAFGRREQGVITPAGNPKQIFTLEDAVAQGARVAQPRTTPGASTLLALLVDRLEGLRDKVKLTPASVHGAQDCAEAVATGAVDCGIGTRAAARAARLDFAPLLWERVDLLVRAQDYFRAPMQALLRFARDERLAQRAAQMQGYDMAEAGDIRYAP